MGIYQSKFNKMQQTFARAFWATTIPQQHQYLNMGQLSIVGQVLSLLL